MGKGGEGIKRNSRIVFCNTKLDDLYQVLYIHFIKKRRAHTEEIAESFVLPQELSVEEEAAARKEFLELRFLRRKQMSEKEHLFTCFPDQVPPGGLHQTTTIPAAYKKVSCSLTLPIGSVSDMHGKGVLTAHKTDFFI